MEVSYDQYPDLALYVQSLAAEHSDPLEILEQTEDELIALYQRNIHGEPIMTAISEAYDQAQAKRIKTRLDLLEVVKDKVIHPQLRNRVLSSMAWMLDIMTINKARDVYYKMYSNTQQAPDISGIDGYNEFMSRFDEVMHGIDDTDSEVVELTRLLGLRDTWHDAAESAATNADRRYNPKSLEQLLRDEKPQTIDSLSMKKMEQQADATNEPQPNETPQQKAEREAVYKQTLAMLVDKQRNQNAERFRARRETLGFILLIIDYAIKHKRECAQFGDLDKTMQERLSDFAQKAIARAQNDMATDRSVTTMEYPSIIKEARAAVAEIGAIATVYFAEPVEPADVRQERQAKAKAQAEARARTRAQASAQAVAKARAKAQEIDATIAQTKACAAA